VVSDEGPGVPADLLETIFDKFRQIGSASTRQHTGAGLGLAISRRLVDAFGGKIWAESEPGRGARFVVRLRLAA
jgi:signal transduction histidine kinase